MKVNRLRHCLLIGLLALMIAMPALVIAQDPAPVFMQEELDQILAPIALYPDPLLAQILMAATYPLEIVLADRWVKENSYLQGDALNDALDQQNWDPSVKALVPFPNILSMMSEEIDWTQDVGEAFLAQETVVMDTIQQLRDKAYAAGNLTSDQKLLVSREDDIITIEPYNPRVVYVPVYDPWVVYGSWWWPHYPPYIVYRYPYDVVISPGIIWYGTGFSVGAFWGHGWGYWDWGHRRCYVNVNRTVNINRTIIINPRKVRTTVWQHDSKHRRGVTYRVPAPRERFVATNRQAVDSSRNYRGNEQSRPTPDTRPNRNITRPAPKTRPGPTAIERPSPKTRPATGVSRPAPKTRSSKITARSAPQTRPSPTAIERPAPDSRPSRNIARLNPQTRPAPAKRSAFARGKTNPARK
jgi:hypothetical protein